MKAGIICTVLGIFMVGIALAQNDMGRFTNYNLKEGISQSSVIDIFQDKNGFMWFGTVDGLNKFDGKKFIIYKNNYKDINSISDNWIYKILLEDSDNNLWILTGDQAINKFNLQTQQFHRYTPIDNKLNTIPEFQRLYNTEEDTIGNIWIATNAGLFKFYRKSNKVKKYNPFSTNNSLTDFRSFYRTYKDSKGNLWVTSSKGISRYNYKNDTFQEYREFRTIAQPVFSGNIIHIFETDKNQLWILTSKGLNIFNPENNQFVPFDFPVKYNFQFNKLEEHAAIHDKNNNLWIPTVNGLLRFNINTSKYHLYLHSGNTPGSISNNRINIVIRDNSGQIWIGTTNGLNLYNPETDNFTRYLHKNSPDNNINSIIALHNGEIWTLGQKNTMGGSQISKLNKQTNYLENVTTNSCDPNSIASSMVYDPFIDRDNNLWLATFNNGVIKYTTQTNKFKHYYNISNDNKSIKTNNIWGFAEDKSGNIWITQSEKIISRFDTISLSFTNYPVELKQKKELRYILMNVVYCENGDLLIATLGAGLLRFNPLKGSVKAYMHNPNDKKTIAGNMLHMITKDSEGKVWIANAFNGVNIFDPVTETFNRIQHDPHNPNSLSNNNLWSIAEDKEHNMWISCEGYIDCYNTQTGKFKHYKAKDNIDYGLLNDKAICIMCDSKGDMWFGTSGGGMSKFNKKTGKFTHYTELEGLANNVVYGILEDHQNNLWLSTNRGISKFNKENQTFTNYYENSGVQGEFNQNAYFKSSTNLIYFGGTNGINVFKPSDIIPDTITPKTILTGFQVSGKRLSVSPKHKKRNGENSIQKLIYDGSNYYLPIDAPYLKEIVIPYHAKVFTLEFTSNEYNFPDKIAFRYKMENFDKDWNYASNNNIATYTNLPAGEYIFRVTAANSDGYWNPESYELKITIVPPFWKSWWFIALNIGLIFCLIWFYIILREKKLKHSKTVLENKIKERTQLIEEKNEELKLRNIEISKQKEEITFQAKQLKSELILQNKVSEMALLRSQINPHFLFNTLNNVYSLVYQKSEEAPASIMKLSEIMRYMLYDAVDGKVALEKEINYLKSFIELQLLRIKNKNFIEFNISGNIYGKTIAPMIFIPFIENAFKHGSKKDGNPGIIINLVLKESNLHFDISNQYQARDTSHKDKTGGIGLTNVRRRLELIYPNEHTLEITKTDDQFNVLLELTLS